MWATCPWQWKLAYIDRHKSEEPSIHLVFGSAIHSVVQYWLQLAFGKGAKRANYFDLDEMFKDEMVKEFKSRTLIQKDGTKIFPCDKIILQEFYLDGIAILKYMRDHYNKIFKIEGWELLGVEIPLKLEVRKNLNYKAYLDIVFKETKTGEIKIVDLKTSTKGWNKWTKADTKKINQILLYKRYYSEIYKVPEEMITVQFVILKRKLYENCDFPQPRISLFEPSDGTPSVNRAVKSFTEFLDSCFDGDGNFNSKVKATPSESNCRFCPFSENKSLCTQSYYLGDSTNV